MKKNILEFCLSPDLGGLELFMTNCYKEFSKRTTCKVIVEKNKKLDNYFEEKDDIHYLKRNKLFPILPALKLAKFIDEYKIDIIHFHWTKDINTVVLGKLLSKRKPKVIQTRNMTMTRFKDDFYHKWLYKNINAMHAVTYQVKEQIEKFIPKEICPKIHMVYMGTQTNINDKKEIERLQEKYDLDKKTFVVGIVGRIEEEKGQFLVIEAISKLKELDIKAMIVGHTMDEEYLNSLKEKIKKLDIEDKIIFTGFTKKVNEHMQLFDVNILATPRETFGLVVIEAMANEVCMIATNNGGPLEIIEDGVDGLLFNRTSEDLAEKINFLYENEEQKKTLAKKGLEKAKRLFDQKTQLNELYKVLERL